MTLDKALVEKVARALYECEAQRSLNAYKVLSAAAQKPTPGILMEPWEECRDTFMADATAALTACNMDEAIKALELAANRLARCALEPEHGSAQRYEWQEWADEARTTLSNLKGGS